MNFIKKVCKNNDCCSVEMPSEVTKILYFNQYHKSDKAPFIIYADIECLIEKIDGFKNNPKNSSTTKVGEHHIIISSSKSTENKHDVYRGADCIKKFCESLRGHAINHKLI